MSLSTQLESDECACANVDGMSWTTNFKTAVCICGVYITVPIATLEYRLCTKEWIEKFEHLQSPRSPPFSSDKDSPTIFEKIFTKETIVIIGVVPACTLIVLAVTIVIGVVLCSYYCAKYNNHHSAPDHYKDIVITALKFVDKEESPEIRKKIISSTDEIFLNTINFCKNEKKILCEKSSSRLPSKQNSTIDSVEDNDGPGELQPPSYESAIAEIDVEERNLRDQLTRHICDFVCLILNDDDYDPGIETTMVDSATERQTSTSANSQIEQREEQNIGIESTVADSATEIQTSR